MVVFVVGGLRHGSVSWHFDGFQDPFRKALPSGTCIDVATVLGGLAGGASVEALALEYQLSCEQIFATLRYDAHVAAHLPPAV